MFCKDWFGPQADRFVSSDVQAILKHRSSARKDSVRTARLAKPNDLAEPTSVDSQKARTVVSGEISSKDGDMIVSTSPGKLALPHPPYSEPMPLLGEHEQ